MADDEDVSSSQEIDFCTLGMFILDEIHYQPPQPSVYNILGGSGTYATLGARIFSPAPEDSRKVSWIVDVGSDFPEEIVTQLKSWQTSCLFRRDPSRLTTRGWNSFDENEDRAFSYMTPKLRLEPKDLTIPLLSSKAYHLNCSPTRCISIVAHIMSMRRQLYLPKPLFIWEPVPDLCVPSELLNLTNALPYIDVCSPNHSELASLMGDSGIDAETGDVDTAAVERACEQLLESMPLNQTFALVIRAGAKGCYVAKNGGVLKRPKKKKRGHHGRGGLTPDMDMFSLFEGLMNDEGAYDFERRDEEEIDPGIEKWIPAYHTSQEKVVDPTGGGNGFLGGMTVALARGKGLEDAALWGSVAASFAIEQVGVPELGVDEEGMETWNGAQAGERVEELRKRMLAGETNT
ncbi:hypothetical protein BP5796_01445 [Coleophoma crateriformis]|uniref:Carbohydrate kinase PfkB domain-containing protein n=1 Tax=Coleophoma crateriformis TaxID=565419 RepID=A0A3D8T0V2_9HELO|nr:hypothetical protein BP5796_01445 [Coleophoma crateriformis]